MIIGARSGSEDPFFSGGMLFSSQAAEAALYRVLSPANQNTYSNIPPDGTEALGLTTDYTPMFEMPYARLVVAGGIGAGEGSKPIQDYQAYAYGGGPWSGCLWFWQIRRQQGRELAVGHHPGQL